MNRSVVIGAAQLGPIARSESRSDVVDRLIVLLHQAHGFGCQLVVYPELALTTFFPRWFTDDQDAIDGHFERSMPGPETVRLFNEASRLGIGFCLGYAELTPTGDHFNTQILVERDGSVVGHYRKVHLPGHEEHEPWRKFQHLERRYFDPGQDGAVNHGRAGSTRQDQGAIARFVASRGRGLHHLALKTSDIDALLARLAAAGRPLIDVRGRPGSRRARIGFLHPRALGGVLLHFVERSA